MQSEVYDVTSVFSYFERSNGNMGNASNFDNSDRSSDNGSLELSCASSSFDEDAFPSDSACKNSEVEPFRFEPYESNSPSEEWDSDDAEVQESKSFAKK